MFPLSKDSVLALYCGSAYLFVFHRPFIMVSYVLIRPPLCFFSAFIPIAFVVIFISSGPGSQVVIGMDIIQRVIVVAAWVSKEIYHPI